MNLAQNDLFTSRGMRMAAAAALLALAVPTFAMADTAFLGITSRSVTGDDARRQDLSTRDGALIQRVYPGTAAEEAGLERGDIIVEFGGERVFDDGDLTHLIRARDPGDAVSIVALRDGERMTLNATLGSYDDFDDDDGGNDWISALGNLFGGGHHERPTLGVHVTELNAQLAKYFEVEETRGVLVTQVVRRSAAEEAGIQAGDVVVQVAGSRIYGAGDIADALEDRFGETVTVSLVRKGHPIELQVKLEDG